MRKITLCIVAAGALITGSSCVNLKKTQAHRPVKMEVSDRYCARNGNKLTVNMTADIPAEYTSTHTGLVVKPYIRGANGAEIQLPPFVVEGRTHKKFNERQASLSPKRADGAEVRYSWHEGSTKVEYTTSVGFEAWMSEGMSIHADIFANAYTRELLIGRADVPGGLLDLRGFIAFTPIEKYYYSDPAGGRFPTDCSGKEKSGLFRFAAGSSHPQGDVWQTRNLTAFIDRVLSNPQPPDYSVEVEVSNSPEGTPSFNRELSGARTEAVRDFLVAAGIPPEHITFRVHEQGWEGLLAVLPFLNLANGDGIEQIIRSTDNPDSKNDLIRNNYPKDYRVLSTQVYPTLRYANVSVVAKHNYGAETAFFYGPGTDTPVDVYELNETMLETLKTGDYNGATALADRIPNTSLPGFIYSNKGMLMLKSNRRSESAALFARAGAIPEARYNLGVLQLLQGDWYAAAANLESYTDINAVVAALHTGNNDKARDILLLLPHTPERDYLLALAYTRLGRDEDAVRILSDALSASPRLREKAAFEPDFFLAEDIAGFDTVIGK